MPTRSAIAVFNLRRFAQAVQGRTLGPVYHGTTRDFQSFDISRSNRNAYGEGFYFTFDRDAAQRYADGAEGGRGPVDRGDSPRVVTAYLTVSKPFRADKTMVGDDDLRRIEAAAGFQLGPFDEAYRPDGGAVWTELVVNSTGDMGTEANKILQRAGFDAIVAPSEIVVFSPSQITVVPKQATASRRFAQRDPDAEYLDAVARGDITRAQGMVAAAALKAGYATGPVWHGTNAKFTSFEEGHKGRYSASAGGFYFAPTRADAAIHGMPMGPFRLRNPSPSGDDFIATDPTQIKLASPVTRDDAGNVIPLSKRFDKSSNDIRY